MIHVRVDIPLPDITQRAPAGRLWAAQDSASRSLETAGSTVRSTSAISVKKYPRNYRLQVADCGLRIRDYGLGITDYGLRIRDYGLRIREYGLRITD